MERSSRRLLPGKRTLAVVCLLHAQLLELAPSRAGHAISGSGHKMRAGLSHAVRHASLGSHRIIARAAVDGAVVARLERHLGLHAAPVTDRGEELASSSLRGRAGGLARGPRRCAARWAASGLVHQPFRRVKLLLTRRPDELVTAVAALKHPVLVRCLHPLLHRLYRRGCPSWLRYRLSARPHRGGRHLRDTPKQGQYTVEPTVWQEAS